MPYTIRNLFGDRGKIQIPYAMPNFKSFSEAQALLNLLSEAKEAESPATCRPLSEAALPRVNEVADTEVRSKPLRTLTTAKALSKQDLLEKPPLVLIADDDQIAQVLMRRVMEQSGFRVEVVADGRQALDAFESLGPDIVLLDVMMPQMDGISACAAIRELPGGQHVPILMVTSLEEGESIRRAFEIGATDFITKPIKWMILEHRVRYMLRASRTYDELCQSRIRLTEAQRIARLGNWELDIEKNNLRWSDEVYDIYGLQDRDCGGEFEAFWNQIHPDDIDFFEKSLAASLREAKPFNIDHRIQLPDGSERIVHQQAEVILGDNGKPIRIAGTTQDISDRRRSEEKIIYLAFHDTLTGLPNRNFFKDHLEKQMAHAKRHGKMLGLLFLDLDQFKRINDTLGHNAGDILLHQVSERIVKCVRKNDNLDRIDSQNLAPTVTRFGGDEFAILLNDLARVDDAARIARRVLAVLAEPFELYAQEVIVGASIGITIYPFGGKDVDALLKTADIAMYHAKEQGRNNYQFYDESLNVIAFERLKLESCLRKALENEEFRLVYQPQVDVLTGKVVGVEALVRWLHPKLGLVPPAKFIPLAEETGLIIPIGEWVLRTAISQNKAWQTANLPPVRVAVNLSNRQFKQKNLVEVTTQALSDVNLDPHYLDLELTEGSVMEDPETAIATLHRLKQMGISLSIDDFGTGYSSLSHLKRFPIDTLKIDRSFVMGIPHDSDDVAITTATIAMGKSLKMKVIAEGVETREQLQFLREQGCAEIQGYLFSPPLDVDDLTSMLKQRKCL